MKTAIRLYAALASIFTGALLSSAILIACLAYLAPEWLAAAGSSLAGAIARATGAATPAGELGTAANPRGFRDLEVSGGLVRAAGEAVVDGEAAVRPASWQEDADTVRLEAVNGALRRKLEAWESLRAPLFGLLAQGPTASPTVAAGGDIVREAPGLAARLAALTGELERPALRLEARTVVRLLLDGAVSDAEARRLLSRLDPTGAREVIERLSRAAPARAARLIRAAAGSTPEGDRGQALVSGSTEEG